MSCTWLTKWGDKSSQRLAAGCRRRVRFSFCICLKRLAGVRDPKGNVTRTYNLSCILARCRPPLLFLSPLTASLCLFQAVPPATVLLVTTSPFNRFRKCPSRVHVTSNLCSPVTSYRFNKHPGISHGQQHPDLHLLEYIYIRMHAHTKTRTHTHVCIHSSPFRLGMKGRCQVWEINHSDRGVLQPAELPCEASSFAFVCDLVSLSFIQAWLTYANPSARVIFMQPNMTDVILYLHSKCIAVT